MKRFLLTVYFSSQSEIYHRIDLFEFLDLRRLVTMYKSGFNFAFVIDVPWDRATHIKVLLKTPKKSLQARRTSNGYC
jgi:hypothetical protein